MNESVARKGTAKLKATPLMIEEIEVELEKQEDQSQTDHARTDHIVAEPNEVKTTSRRPW